MLHAAGRRQIPEYYLHVAHTVRQDYKNVLIRTVDTDVVFLAVTAAGPWVLMSSVLLLVLNFRFLLAHKIAAALGPNKCRGLPFFHVFTGCYTVSCFSGRGKQTAWGSWKACDEGTDVTTLFCALSTLPNPSAVDDNIDVLGLFVVLLCDRTRIAENTASV